MLKILILSTVMVSLLYSFNESKMDNSYMNKKLKGVADYNILDKNISKNEIFIIDNVSYSRHELSDDNKNFKMKKFIFSENINKFDYGFKFRNEICNNYRNSFHKTYLYKYNRKLVAKNHKDLPGTYQPKIKEIKINKKGLWFKGISGKWKKQDCMNVLYKKVRIITPDLFEIKIKENFCDDGSCTKIKKDMYYTSKNEKKAEKQIIKRKNKIIRSGRSLFY
jgi:hypothetical protein